MWLIRCDCGLEKTMPGGALRDGDTKQCLSCRGRARSLAAGRTEPKLRPVAPPHPKPNTPPSVFLELDGRRQSAKAWAHELNIPYNTLLQRKRRLNWSDERCLTTPWRPREITPEG